MVWFRFDSGAVGGRRRLVAWQQGCGGQQQQPVFLADRRPWWRMKVRTIEEKSLQVNVKTGIGQEIRSEGNT
ncbi:hypothetical protein QVD17_19862 [Tagetes erecta]|uniref:Uncharacterized protein n=1 Tax=Tagetes erecta TaxID=13708 RepID=A0AAD8NXC1_TARER|nr:hypothetical protein QVD17_19862 [Tagetes erecta]